LGAATGAAIIKFNPKSIPDGIDVTLDGEVYNGLMSSGYGWKQAPPSLTTFVGSSLSDCGIVANSPHEVQKYEWDGGQFVATGTTETFSVLPSQMRTNPADEVDFYMVIPKPFPSPSSAVLRMYGPCEATEFEFTTYCPEPLPSMQASTVFNNPYTVCNGTINQTYYYFKPNPDSYFPMAIFTDPNGQFKADQGYYKTDIVPGKNWISVDSNGLYADSGECDPSAVDNLYAYSESCVGGSVNDYIGLSLSLTAPVTKVTNFIVSVFYVFSGTGGCNASSPKRVDLSVTVQIGSSSGYIDACSGGYYVPGGADVCSACIKICDNPDVSLTGFKC
jgi:hypothetical protein